MKYKSSKIERAILLLSLMAAVVLFVHFATHTKENILKEKTNKHLPVWKKYVEKSSPTPNFDKERKNEVIGVVLHHTAEPTLEKSLAILSSPEKKVGTHVVIDKDGTRYVMAEPNVATYHAGLSILNGHEGCNYCTIGIEFQGNTLVEPLTEDQILSGIEYLLPIIAQYEIPMDNIVTHEMVRTAYMQKYPKRRCSGKVDITPEEYLRFMNVLRPAWKEYRDKATY